ncbi:MAG: AAA family ATPase [Candidatus Limnocylindrales bacterium]
MLLGPGSATNARPRFVLTGGPGGGKSTLIEELRVDPTWADRFVAWPETVSFARFAGIQPTEKLFERVVVNLAVALEDALDRALDPTDRRVILCHRGSLDALAFWRQRGWSPGEFYAFTRTTREGHYARYAGVIHLVTAANGAPAAYARWPDAHRPGGDGIALAGHSFALARERHASNLRREAAR